MSFEVVHGDCLATLRGMADDSVDAVVTDPPAGISFMGKAWDGDRGGRAGWVEWLTGVMCECLRVLKPGGHALVWALPRTSHWTATAVEDAGFEIRDVLTHLFGTGFPKSLNAGGGRGTALKPASEHWILARKPLIGTVAANVQVHGTGAINVDACRVAGAVPQTTQGRGSHGIDGWGMGERQSDPHAAGRFPPNLLLSHAPGCERVGVRMVATGTAVNRNRTPGEMSSWFGTRASRVGDDASYASPDGTEEVPAYLCAPGCPVAALDEPARFFPTFEPDYDAPFLYAAKASRGEREAGLREAGLREAHPSEITGRKPGSAGAQSPRAGMTERPRANHHPTVKSLALMRWLCRLITPPGGIVLDPFTGSGSTGCAAVLEGFRFVGCEREAEYVEIAMARIAHHAGLLGRAAG